MLTDGRTDGRTDGLTDGRTDRPFYRDARTHLKRERRKKEREKEIESDEEIGRIKDAAIKEDVFFMSFDLLGRRKMAPLRRCHFDGAACDDAG